MNAREESRVRTGTLDLDHVEISLWGSASRADPDGRYVGPACPRGEAFGWIALGLVIEVAARPALPDFEVTHVAASAVSRAPDPT